MTGPSRFRVAYRLADGGTDPVAAGISGLDRAKSTAATFLAPSSPADRQPVRAEIYAGAGWKGPDGYEWRDNGDGPVAVGTVTDGRITWHAAPDPAPVAEMTGPAGNGGVDPAEGEALTLFALVAS